MLVPVSVRPKHWAAKELKNESRRMPCRPREMLVGALTLHGTVQMDSVRTEHDEDGYLNGRVFRQVDCRRFAFGAHVSKANCYTGMICNVLGRYDNVQTSAPVSGLTGAEIRAQLLRSIKVASSCYSCLVHRQAYGRGLRGRSRRSRDRDLGRTCRRECGIVSAPRDQPRHADGTKDQQSK
jgi:hypothetical protein